VTFVGVPILDWVILGALLLLGVEAWVTCRPARRQPPPAEDPVAPREPGPPTP
jgi:hypothetical protein